MKKRKTQIIAGQILIAAAQENKDRNEKYYKRSPNKMNVIRKITGPKVEEEKMKVLRK